VKLRLATQPVAYEKAAKAIVYLLVGFAIVTWTDAQIVLVLAVIESVLGLIVWASVTPNVKVHEKIATAAASARNEALADVASLTPAKPAPAKRAAKKAPARR
jgi:hypothetical protein